jgi:hypothetical protein
VCSSFLPSLRQLQEHLAVLNALSGARNVVNMVEDSGQLDIVTISDFSPQTESTLHL